MTNNTYHPRNRKVHDHSVRKHSAYSAWAGLKDRCDNINSSSYPNYGGRGISYYKAWVHFENFADDMGPKPTPDHSIERVDNDGNYDKDNCIWATRHEQSLNRRTFTNNSTGYTGVKLVKKSGRYTATMHFKKVRYMVSGSFETIDQAGEARAKLLALLKAGEDVTHLTQRGIRCNNTTGVTGISSCKKGGYIARIVRGGERKYLGYFKHFDDAKEAIENEQK